jgi:hypothetical protein
MGVYTRSGVILQEADMARVRSPNYPAFGLPEAINRIRAIHAAEQHLAAPKEVIAKHLGYNGINGGSLKAISALLKYGLLEEAQADKFKVSPLAISILFPAKGEDREAAIREAALKPALFQEIYTEWEGGQPSDENLRAYLIRRQFASDALDRVIQSYKETMELLTQDPKGDTAIPSGGATGQQENAAMQTAQQAPVNRTPTPTPAVGPMSVSFTGDRLQVSATLEDGEAVDKLIKALTATKALLPEKKMEPAPETAN